MANLNTTYRKTILTDLTQPQNIISAIEDYQAVIWANLNWLLGRYRQVSNYPWIDTKYNLITGCDYSQADSLKGYGSIYGWIQGRAIESLAGHARWLDGYSKTEPIARCQEKIKSVLIQVIESVQEFRAKNGGHLFFFMSPEGRPMTCDGKNLTVEPFMTADSRFNYSDLFAAKGLYAAAAFLGDSVLIDEAGEYVSNVFNAIIDREFYVDQQPLNPQNPPQSIPGRHSQGPYMIQLGAAAMLAEYCPDRRGIVQGVTLLNHLIGRHVNLNNRWPELGDHVFVEFIDDDDRPYRDNGAVLCDPGHALEFVGLALKFIEAAKNNPAADIAEHRQLDHFVEILFSVFRRHFELGFLDSPGGIVKSVDLLSRRTMNSQLPWWSVTETIRAAARCLALARTDRDHEFFLNAWRKCHNSLISKYIQPDRNFLCVQTRSADGQIIDAIPGTTDIDPGYHTGLCLIDSLRFLSSSNSTN